MHVFSWHMCVCMSIIADQRIIFCQFIHAMYTLFPFSGCEIGCYINVLSDILRSILHFSFLHIMFTVKHFLPFGALKLFVCFFQLSGWFLVGTHSITKDMKKAFEYSQKACDLGNRYSCANLSQMYKKGDGVTKDAKLAEKYRLRAKELHDEVTQTQRTITLNQWICEPAGLCTGCATGWFFCLWYLCFVVEYHMCRN